MLALATYMVTTRVLMPRFGSPWLGRRERQRAIERAEQMLARATLGEDDRYRLQRCLASLRARGSGREAWGGSVPERDLVAEIDAFWEELQAKEESPEIRGRC
jgi:hypothetical protein